MNARRAVLVVFGLALALTSGVAAGPGAAKQRVAITATGVANPTSAGTFVLTPLQPGALKPDSGTETSVIASQHVVMRDGQRVEIVTWVTTCKGKRGSFVLRVRLDQVEAGNGYHVGTGAWKFLRGTGAYAKLSGGGRDGNVWLDSGPWSERREGFLAVL